MATGTAVTGLIRDEDGRVAGVRVSPATGDGETHGGTAHERVLRARLVVGADGRSSTVARLADAPAPTM
ncbi:hypothetical protein AB0939_06230 [Streptomyces sp. NPDC006990]|uniref:hypothetical protein n=1 Tax=Streptomyces sp. NPDC006990 TaxID=3154481 RepID=UPI003455160E